MHSQGRNSQEMVVYPAWGWGPGSTSRDTLNNIFKLFTELKLFFIFHFREHQINRTRETHQETTSNQIKGVQSPHHGRQEKTPLGGVAGSHGDPPQDELQSDPPTKKPESALPWVWAAGSGLHPTPNHPHRRSGPQTQQCWSGGP